MKPITLFILLCSLTINGYAQNSILGNVYYHNSNKKPAPNIHIIAEGSNNDYSKSDGSYKLDFEQKQLGDRINIVIEGNDSIALLLIKKRLMSIEFQKVNLKDLIL